MGHLLTADMKAPNSPTSKLMPAPCQASTTSLRPRASSSRSSSASLSQDHPPAAAQTDFAGRQGTLSYQIPGRELPGEVATRRLWSVCKALGAVLLETTEDAGLAETPPSAALDLETKVRAPLSKGPCQHSEGPEWGPARLSAMDTRLELRFLHPTF